MPDRLFWCVPAVFAAVAGLMLADPWRQPIPIPAATEVPPSAVDTTPVRQPVLNPQTVIAGMRYRCRECHDLFPSPEETDRPLTQHEEIVLEHGINNRCFNCHHREDREAPEPVDGMIPHGRDGRAHDGHATRAGRTPQATRPVSPPLPHPW